MTLTDVLCDEGDFKTTGEGEFSLLSCPLSQCQNSSKDRISLVNSVFAFRFRLPLPDTLNLTSFF